MNKDIIKGNWNQFKGTVRQKWAKLTDDDLAYIEGSSEKLVGKLQELYGMAKEEAEKECECLVAASETQSS